MVKISLSKNIDRSFFNRLSESILFYSILIITTMLLLSIKAFANDEINLLINSLKVRETPSDISKLNDLLLTGDEESITQILEALPEVSVRNIAVRKLMLEYLQDDNQTKQLIAVGVLGSIKEWPEDIWESLNSSINLLEIWGINNPNQWLGWGANPHNVRVFGLLNSRLNPETYDGKSVNNLIRLTKSKNTSIATNAITFLGDIPKYNSDAIRTLRENVDNPTQRSTALSAIVNQKNNGILDKDTVDFIKKKRNEFCDFSEFSFDNWAQSFDRLRATDSYYKITGDKDASELLNFINNNLHTVNAGDHLAFALSLLYTIDPSSTSTRSLLENELRTADNPNQIFHYFADRLDKDEYLLKLTIDTIRDKRNRESTRFTALIYLMESGLGKEHNETIIKPILDALESDDSLGIILGRDPQLMHYLASMPNAYRDRTFAILEKILSTHSFFPPLQEQIRLNPNIGLDHFLTSNIFDAMGNNNAYLFAQELKKISNGTAKTASTFEKILSSHLLFPFLQEQIRLNPDSLTENFIVGISENRIVLVLQEFMKMNPNYNPGALLNDEMLRVARIDELPSLYALVYKFPEIRKKIDQRISDAERNTFDINVFFSRADLGLEEDSGSVYKGADFITVASINTSDISCGDKSIVAKLVQFYLENKLPSGFILPVRGGGQVENTTVAVENFIRKCVSENPSLFLTRLLPIYLPAETDSIHLIRNLAMDVANVFPEFMGFRQTIHDRPSQAHIAETERFIQLAKERGLAPTIISDLEQLKQELQEVYNLGDFDVDFFIKLQDFSNKKRFNLDGLINDLNQKMQDGSDNLTLLDSIHNLARDLRSRFKEKSKFQPEELVQLTKALNTLINGDFAITRKIMDEISSSSDKTKLKKLLPYVIESLQFEGILSDEELKQHQAMLSHLEKMADEKVAAWIQGILGNAYQKLSENFGEIESFLSQFSDEAKNFTPDLIRSSALLTLSEIRNMLVPNIIFEAYQTGRTCGRVKLVTAEDLKTGTLKTNKEDIIFLPKGLVLPNNISEFGAAISEEQMPLASHIMLEADRYNVPVAYSQKVFEENKDLDKINGKPLCLEIDFDKAKIEFVDEDSLALYFENKIETNGKKTITPLLLDSITSIQDLTSQLDSRNYNVLCQSCGSKASNYSELFEILGIDYVREGLAIPFKFYLKYIEQKVDGITLKDRIEELLKGMHEGLFNKEEKNKKLEELRQAFLKAKVNQDDLRYIAGELQNKFGNRTEVRLRSSSNAEDGKEFMGAGLYESFSAKTWRINEDIRNDGTERPRTIEGAIKKAYASLWSERAFDARENAGVDHSKVAMGLLVHESFDEEELANGVAIISKENGTVKVKATVQHGETSVTNPEGFSLPEQYEITVNPDGSFSTKILRYSTLPFPNDVLSEARQGELAQHAAKIYSHFSGLYKEDVPIDIEFKVVDESIKYPENDPGSVTKKRIGERVMVKQARPFREKN